MEGQVDDDAGRMRALRGYSLIFDVARRFAQPLGIRLPDWEGRIIETDKGVVRLLSVAERARILFGQDGARGVARQLEQSARTTPQLALFPEEPSVPVRGRRGRTTRRGGERARGGQEAPVALEESGGARPEATTLDRVHAGMLLQAAGQTHALRALLKSEQERGPDFLRLANALSALYPKGSEEKRLLDAMLLAVPR